VQVIAHNLCIDTLRDRGRVAPSEAPAEEARAPASDDPEDAVLRGEAASLVQLALADLPPRQRDVVVARHLEDRRPGEIAAALGLSVGAVDSLLLRGRRRLAAAVERLSGDRGAISAQSASTVAAGVAGGSGKLNGVIESIQTGVTKATYHVAASLGMVPGVAGPAHRVAAAVLMGGAVAAGAVAPSPSPTPLPAIEVPAAPLPERPTLAVPALPGTPAAPRIGVAVPATDNLVPDLSAGPDAQAPIPVAPTVLPAIGETVGGLVDGVVSGTIRLLDQLGDVLHR
jgi:hypothetical protein